MLEKEESRASSSNHLALSRQVRVDRNVYAELVRRAGELGAQLGRRRVPLNDLIRRLLVLEDEAGVA